jgi:hypothetical protein
VKKRFIYQYYLLFFTDEYMILTMLTRMMAGVHERGQLENFTRPDFPAMHNSVVACCIKHGTAGLKFTKYTILFFGIYLIGPIFFLPVLDVLIGYDPSEQALSGRDIEINEDGVWFLTNGSLSEPLNDTELRIGDRVQFTFAGEIKLVKYSFTSCSPPVYYDTSYYGPEEDCWTTYDSRYTFMLGGQSVDTEEINRFFFCHRNICEIEFEVVSIQENPNIEFLRVDEAVR